MARGASVVSARRLDGNGNVFQAQVGGKVLRPSRFRCLSAVLLAPPVRTHALAPLLALLARDPSPRRIVSSRAPPSLSSSFLVV